MKDQRGGRSWEGMSARERDAMVAEWMGCRVRMLEHPPYGGTCECADRRHSPSLLGPLFAYTADHNAARLVEDEVMKRGLIEKYQTALIKILGLGMQVFNSAIEIGSYADLPDIPNNSFEWDGHAFLWSLLRATPDQKCRAALRAGGVEC